MKSRVRLLLLLVLTAGLAFTIQADPPAWWSEQGIIAEGESGPVPADDFAAINQGQLKNFALAAYRMLDSSLPGGAGETLRTHIGQFYDFGSGEPVVKTTTDNFAVTNQNQLKTVVAPFYDRLLEAGYITATGTAPSITYTYSWYPSGQRTGHGKYPWDGSPTPPDDFAAANIGQAKFLLAFDPAVDSDNDSIPDWWEQAHYADLDQTAETDSDHDGLTDLEEFYQNSNPNDFFNGETPVLQIVSGNHQGDLPDLYLAHPLVVRILNNVGTPLKNLAAAVDFVVTSAEGEISVSTTDDLYGFNDVLSVDTDAVTGDALVYVKLPATVGATITVEAAIGDHPEITPAEFTATVGDSSLPPASAGGVVVTRTDSTHILITWEDLSNNETGYTVERKSGVGAWAQRGSLLPPNTTSYLDTVLSGVTYQYRIITHNATGGGSGPGGPGTGPSDGPPTPPNIEDPAGDLIPPQKRDNM